MATLKPAEIKQLAGGSNPFKKAYYQFGYLPLLLVLDNFLEEEYFMTCHLIKEALKEVTAGESVPLEYCEAALDAVKKDFHERGWDDKLNEYLLNVPHYAAECRKYIEANYHAVRY